MLRAGKDHFSNIFKPYRPISRPNVFQRNVNPPSFQKSSHFSPTSSSFTSKTFSILSKYSFTPLQSLQSLPSRIVIPQREYKTKYINWEQERAERIIRKNLNKPLEELGFVEPEPEPKLYWVNENHDFHLFIGKLMVNTAMRLLIFLVWACLILSSGVLIINTTPTEKLVNDAIADKIAKQTGLEITYDKPDFLNAFLQDTTTLKNVRVVRPPPVPPSENWCIFDLTIEEVVLKTSYLWFLRGRGFVKSIQISGVRGTVDRRTEWYDPRWKPRNWDIFWGDFHFKDVKVNNCNFTMYFPDPNQRPVSVHIQRLESKRMRRRYLLYDLVCSNRIDAVFDGCKMTYRKAKNQNRKVSTTEMNLNIKGVSVEFLSRNAEGPLGWLKKGQLDFDLQVFIPPPYYQVDDISMIVHTKIRKMKLDPQFSLSADLIAFPVARYFNRYKSTVQLTSHISVPWNHFDKSWSLADAEFWDKMSDAIAQSLTEMYTQNKPRSLSEWWEYIWKTLKA